VEAEEEDEGSEPGSHSHAQPFPGAWRNPRLIRAFKSQAHESQVSDDRPSSLVTLSNDI